MASDIANGDIAQVVISQRLNGQTLLNVLHYKCSVDVGAPPMDTEQTLFDLITDLRAPDSLIATMKNMQTTDLGYNYVQAQIVGPTRRPYVRTTFNEFGELDPPTAPTGCNAVVTKQSAIAGRGKTGSFHLGGFGLDAIIDSVLVPTAKVLLAFVADEIIKTRIVVQAIPASAVSFGPILVSNPQTTSGTEMESVTIQPQVRYMTRRTVGRGI